MSEQPLRASDASGETGNDPGALAAMLAPAIVEACHGRLSMPTWFRAAWQAGGASTGYAVYRHDDGSEIDAVVKIPVAPSELNWTTAMSESSLSDQPSVRACTPRVLASGRELGGYDLAWLVIERLSGAPLNTQLNHHAVEDLLLAAAHWYTRARTARDVRQAPAPKDEPWHERIAKAREIVKEVGIAEPQRWNEALRHVQRALDALVGRWRARPINTWCHGDLHFGNAMRRKGQPPGGGCVLIDFALVHPGHWVEDAVYLERLYWAKPELLCGIKPVSIIAKHLRDLGQVGSEDYAGIAHVRRALMAASVPLYLEHEGHPKYVHAALEMLERTLAIVAH